MGWKTAPPMDRAGVACHLVFGKPVEPGQPALGEWLFPLELGQVGLGRSSFGAVSLTVSLTVVLTVALLGLHPVPACGA